MSVALLGATAMVFGCGGGSDNADAGSTDAPVTRGTMSLSWSITDLDGNPLACADVAALSISLQMTRQGSAAGVVDPYTCAAGAATSRELDPGTYDVVVMAAAQAGNLTTPIVLEPVEVVAGQNTVLDPIVFRIDPVGNFSFRIDTGASAGNCADEAAGGGALTALEIRLLDDGDVCIPTTFVIGDVNPVTYVSDCQGSTTGCVDKDVDFSVIGTASGPHTLEIIGDKDGLECYSRTSMLAIPGNDLGRMLGNLVLSLAPVPGCDPNAPDAGVVPDAGVPDAG
ncbi:MAG TPA: hypothetical protein VML75_16625 [Kofleriaceae bacterium]|nr:hypothetical protein [Kofleriaceae bacterium]